MEQTRRHYFPANHEVVVTGILSSGRYGARLEGEPNFIGYGHSRLSAISDLNKELERDREC